MLADPADSLQIPTPGLTSKWLTAWSLEAGALGSSSGSTPFWLQTNQYGTIPKTAPVALLKASAQRDYVPAGAGKRRKTDWGYGLELVGWGGASNQLLVAQAYIKARLGIFELSAGRRRQIVGLAESPLSSGSFIWSGNSLPIPQIQLSLPEYVPLSFTKNFLALKANFAHGWFGDGPYVQGSYLHQKAVYLRLGKPQAKVKAYGTFTHFVQWGGYAPFLESDPTISFNGQLAQSWDAYLNVVVPVKTDALKNLSKFTTFDQNRVGDHRGTAEIALEYNNAHGTIWAYQQHFYDVGRKLYNFRNIEDGLYGLRYLSNKPYSLINEVVLELLNTGNQGVIQFGRYLGGEPENYFLNAQYPESWSYQGRTLGSPFLSQASDTRADLPRIPFAGYTLSNQLIAGNWGINNNRVWVIHGGLSGWFTKGSNVRIKASYSKNYGAFGADFPEGTTQLSVLAGLTQSLRWLKGSSLLLSLGYDRGLLLATHEQLGGYVGLRKEWGKPR